MLCELLCEHQQHTLFTSFTCEPPAYLKLLRLFLVGMHERFFFVVVGFVVIFL